MKTIDYKINLSLDFVKMKMDQFINVKELLLMLSEKANMVLGHKLENQVKSHEVRDDIYFKPQNEFLRSSTFAYILFFYILL